MLEELTKKLPANSDIKEIEKEESEVVKTEIIEVTANALEFEEI